VCVCVSWKVLCIWDAVTLREVCVCVCVISLETALAHLSCNKTLHRPPKRVWTHLEDLRSAHTHTHTHTVSAVYSLRCSAGGPTICRIVTTVCFQENNCQSTRHRLPRQQKYDPAPPPWVGKTRRAEIKSERRSGLTICGCCSCRRWNPHWQMSGPFPWTSSRASPHECLLQRERDSSWRIIHVQYCATESAAIQTLVCEECLYSALVCIHVYVYVYSSACCATARNTVRFRAIMRNTCWVKVQHFTDD